MNGKVLASESLDEAARADCAQMLSRLSIRNSGSLDGRIDAQAFSDALQIAFMHGANWMAERAMLIMAAPPHRTPYSKKV